MRAATYAAIALSTASAAFVVACGDATSFDVAPSSTDSGAETSPEIDGGIDSAVDASRDSGRDSAMDAATDSGTESAIDSAMDVAEHDSSIGDSGIDAMEDAMDDSIDDSMDDAIGDAIDDSVDAASDAPDTTDAIATIDATPDVDAAEIVVDAPCDVPVFCYPDADLDGYASPTGAFASCGACPSGSLAVDPSSAKFDCDDLDPSVHPGVTSFQTTAYCVPGTGCAEKSFDYDCDGTETREWTTIGGACATSGSGCSGDGWIASAVPDCGADVSWLTCTRELLSCKSSSADRVQGCR